jgi:Xaa-Pro dipeptidase
MYYLTGYDSFGYVFFQCLYLGADGSLTLLTRVPDRRVARYTSIIDDVRVWIDRPDAEPAVALRAILDEHGCRGKRLGVEWDAYGLTAANGRRLTSALDGFCMLEDASDLVTRQRAVKRPAELVLVRRAAQIADIAMAETRPLLRAGAFEGDILAKLQGAVFQEDGDYPGNEFIIGSGPAAHLGRYIAGRRSLDNDDQLTLEFAGVFRHYHACLMRTIKVGRPSALHLDMHKCALESLAGCAEALRPGRPVGEVYEVYARTVARSGYDDDILQACGYSLGATFSPNWMDWPMLFRGNQVEAVPGMVFFLHMAISHNGLTVSPGETFVVTETGCERLGNSPLSLTLE